MEFDEIDFWIAAVADYNRAVNQTISARRDRNNQ
jgi:hypothetical protein